MKVVFFGTPDFAVPSLDMLTNSGYEVTAAVTQPDKPKGRGNKLLPTPVKAYAIDAGIPVMQPEKAGSPEFVSELKKLAPGLIVTAAYGKILPQAVLDIPSMGCINVHASLLPRYRGAAPIQRAIMNGDRVTGITTMMMDIGIDTGDILLQQQVDIDEDMTAGELHNKLALIGAGLLCRTICMLAEGGLSRVPQPLQGVTYAPPIRKEDGLIDWNASGREVHDRVRAANPWPGAYTSRRGDRMRIWRTRSGPVLQERDERPGRPGTVMDSSKSGILVKCGTGCVSILEIQFDSGKRLPVEECWHNIHEGEVLG